MIDGAVTAPVVRGEWRESRRPENILALITRVTHDDWINSPKSQNPYKVKVDFTRSKSVTCPTDATIYNVQTTYNAPRREAKLVYVIFNGLS